MTWMILAELLIKCPKENLKISVKEKCQGTPPCPHYRHYAFVGGKIYVVCDYGVKSTGKT